MSISRRNFIKDSAKASAVAYAAAMGFSAKSYANIIGANDRVRVGVVGYSDRHKSSHMPCFMNHYKELNFDLVAVSDIWKKEGKKALRHGKKKWGMILRSAATMKRCMIKN